LIGVDWKAHWHVE